jgi:hypothetical protein
MIKQLAFFKRALLITGEKLFELIIVKPAASAFRGTLSGGNGLH